MKQKRMDNDHPSGVLQNRMPDSVNQKVSTHDQVRRVGNTMLCLLTAFSVFWQVVTHGPFV